MDDKTAFQRYLTDPRRSALDRYRYLVVGEAGFGKLLAYELFTGLCGGIPGLVGLWLRRHAYRPLFHQLGRDVVFGRHVVIRQPANIEIGNGTVIDDGCVLDVKGEGERGISLGAGVLLGRNTIVSAKGSRISIADTCNVGSTCRIATTAGLEIGRGTLIAAYAYLGGGNHGWQDSSVPVIAQEMETAAGLRVGEYCWIGAGATILDGCHLGEHSIVGAGAVVTKPVAPYTIVAGVPARVVAERKH